MYQGKFIINGVVETKKLLEYCSQLGEIYDIVIEDISSKKAWLKERFDEGLVCLKSEERRRCFVEYIPVQKEKGVQFKAIHLQSKEQAQNVPTPITTYALFYNGEYLTNEPMNEKDF